MLCSISGGAPPRRRDDTGHPLHAAVPHRFQQRRDGGFALAPDHGVHRAPRLLDDLLGDERDAVAAEEHEAVRQLLLHPLGEPDRLGDVRQVVQRDPERLRAERPHLVAQPPHAQHLEVDHPDLVTRLTGGAGHPLQAQGFEPEEDLGVHQGAGVDEQQAHEGTSSRCREQGGMSLS